MSLEFIPDYTISDCIIAQTTPYHWLPDSNSPASADVACYRLTDISQAAIFGQRGYTAYDAWGVCIVCSRRFFRVN